ncbi:ATP-binding protein, partial [Ideonella sp.]|uniref:ATP-binding protein n=1 Tax=Ideonella sp. TaxID=1929293 RepID=UPI002B47514D
MACERCAGHERGDPRRRGKKTIASGTVYLCTSDEDMVKSKKVFVRTLESYAAMIEGLVEIQRLAAEEAREEGRRLVHNLTTLNSHIIQEIYNIVPQDELAGTPNRQISVIAGAISQDPQAAAQAALRILKNAVAARTEMQVVRRFRTTPQLPPQLRGHMIHKVIKNVLITFFQEAQDKELYWNLRATGERVWVDYELVSAALYRFFENCVKYCAPTSTIDIGFQPKSDRLDVIMEMKSLPIGPEEERRIFDEGVSGSMAQKHGLSGSGLGLSIVRQLLEVNDAAVFVAAGTRVETIRGIEYAPNRFTFSFSRVTIKKG